jgi:hypothetical protein
MKGAYCLQYKQYGFNIIYRIMKSHGNFVLSYLKKMLKANRSGN